MYIVYFKYKTDITDYTFGHILVNYNAINDLLC